MLHSAEESVSLLEF